MGIAFHKTSAGGYDFLKFSRLTTTPKKTKKDSFKRRTLTVRSKATSEIMGYKLK